MQNQRDDVSKRELVIARVLDAPVKLVWEVWINPEHVQHWWGPDGFTNTITKMDVIPGGQWDITMHGPDGTNYFYSCFFTEVVRFRKIVYEHKEWPRFVGTVDFEKQGNKTFIRWQMLFETRETLQEFVQKHGADEGMKQNVAKLENYVNNIKDVYETKKYDLGKR